jgi:hypothetical protein
MDNQDQTKNDKAAGLITLKDFIDDHQKILAVIGVFVALAVFWSNLPLKYISSFISFLCLAATVPLFIEIYRSYNYKKSSWLLTIFLNIFAPLMGYTAWYLLVGFRSHWQTQMWNLVFWTFAIPAWFLYKKMDVPKRYQAWETKLLQTTSRKNSEKLLAKSELPEEAKKQLREELENERLEKAAQRSTEDRKDIRIPINILAVLVIFIIGGFIAQYLGAVINKQLDKVYESYKTAEQAPTPPPTPVVSQSPIPTPVQSPTPIQTPTPTPTPTSTPTPTQRNTKRQRRY